MNSRIYLDLSFCRMFENRGPHMIENDYTPLSALDIFVKDLVRLINIEHISYCSCVNIDFFNFVKAILMVLTGHCFS